MHQVLRLVLDGQPGSCSYFTSSEPHRPAGGLWLVMLLAMIAPASVGALASAGAQHLWVQPSGTDLLTYHRKTIGKP